MSVAVPSFPVTLNDSPIDNRAIMELCHSEGMPIDPSIDYKHCPHCHHKLDPEWIASAGASAMYKLRDPNSIRGELHGRSKLTRAKVDQIRELYAKGGITQQALAEKFHISRATISAVTNKTVWKTIAKRKKGQ